HAEPEFYTWMPDRRSLDELLQKFGERVGPQGLGDREVVEPALREETLAATDRFFLPEGREIIAARMRDVALSIRAPKGDRARGGGGRGGGGGGDPGGGAHHVAAARDPVPGDVLREGARVAGAAERRSAVDPDAAGAADCPGRAADVRGAPGVTEARARCGLA